MKRMKRTSVWMFGNNKGGVGKTTISLNVAAAISEQNKTALYIDIDDSINSTNHLKLPGSMEPSFPVSHLFFNKDVDINDCILWHTKLPGIAMIKSERGIKKSFAAFSSNNSKREVEEMTHRFASRLQELDGVFDYIIIDVGPSMDSALAMVLEAVTHYVFVADSSAYAEQGIYNVMEDVPRLRPDAVDGIKLVGAIYSNINMNSSFAKKIVTRTEIASEVPMIPIFIPHRVEIAENMLSQDFAVSPEKESVLATSFRRLFGVIQDCTQETYPGAEAQ
jgi:chromosome partitioning protein